MAGSAGRFLDVRPVLSRTRSSSSPITPNDAAQEALESKPTRPGHFRSRSYISPTEQKPPSAATFPLPNTQDKVVEPSRFPRLHLHGKHHHTNSEDQKPAHAPRKHRYTQSEQHQYRRDDGTHQREGQTTYSPTTAFESSIRFPYPSSRGAAIPSLSRMASFRNGPQFGDSPYYGYQSHERLTNSDTNRSQPLRKKSSVEKLLDKTAEPRLAMSHVTQSSVDKLDGQLEEAQSELYSRLSNTSKTASSLMRRLDQTHDTLRRTADSLVDTISSFSNLSQQSAKLISNFDNETSHLDSSLHSRLQHFNTNICTKRSQRIEELENRGKVVSEKAEELGRRLENCRTIIKNWEDRETNKRKAWKGVRNGLFWGFLLILIGVLAGIASWKAIEGSSQSLQDGTSIDKNMTQKEILQGTKVPEDVKKLLRDIATRQDRGIKVEIQESRFNVDGRSMARADQRIKLLDEL